MNEELSITMVDSNLVRRSFSSNAEETPFTMFYNIAKHNSCDLLSNWGSKKTWGLFLLHIFTGGSAILHPPICINVWYIPDTWDLE